MGSPVSEAPNTTRSDAPPQTANHHFFTPNKIARALPYPICGPNRLKVTVKQIHDASNDQPHMGRCLLGGAPLYTVQVCGILQSIQRNHDKTCYVIFDGTGSLQAVAWPSCPGGKTELTGACIGSYYIINGTISTRDTGFTLSTLRASKVNNYNEITEHFLSAIHESLSLQQRLQTIANKPETVRWSQKQLCKSAIRDVLRKDPSDAGLTARAICASVSNPPATISEALAEMIDDGQVYNTIDYFHYKLAD